MLVKPFRGLRPRASLATRIPSYPYDVISSDEARELARDDPYTFLHVVKPEIDLDPDIGLYDDRVYAKGRENLRSMIEKGWLVRDQKPAYYVYRLVMGDRAQTGILGAAAVRDYLEDRIKKHEHTRPEKEKDRVRLNDVLSAAPGPVFLTYKTLPELNAVVTGVTARDPATSFTAADGIEHTLWLVEDAAVCSKIEKLLGAVRRSYVADGHHRAAAAAKVGAERAARLEEPTGEEPCHFFLAAMFPADQLQVLDYNRVVVDLNGLDPESFLERVERAGFHVRTDHRAKRPPHRETFGMYLDRRWYLLTASPQIVASSDVVLRLDVSILTERLLQPILGIGDPRTDKRIDFVGGIRGMEELERRVDSGRDAVAFALHPTSVQDVMDVADAGQVMPPKSTWFEPKLRSGMVVQLLDGETL
jgi:uncharacterized protein (DUF1015 family)